MISWSSCFAGASVSSFMYWKGWLRGSLGLFWLCHCMAVWFSMRWVSVWCANGGYFFVSPRLSWFNEQSPSCRDWGGALVEGDIPNLGRKKRDGVSVSGGICLWKQEGPAQTQQADLGKKVLCPGTQTWKQGREERKQLKGRPRLCPVLVMAWLVAYLCQDWLYERRGGGRQKQREEAGININRVYLSAIQSLPLCFWAYFILLLYSEKQVSSSPCSRRKEQSPWARVELHLASSHWQPLQGAIWPVSLAQSKQPWFLWQHRCSLA